MKFRPSTAAEEFIENVHQRVRARNKAVLGRSALMLALNEGVPRDFKLGDAQGKDIDDEYVIGDELKDVVRAALNFRAGRALDEAGYRQEFRKHFEYGCLRLKQIWDDSGNDQTQFVTQLLRLGGEHAGTADGPAPGVKTQKTVKTVVELKLLTEVEPWRMNDTKISGQNNSLLIISGQPGSGKSQLALDLLAQLSRQGVRFLFFDLKGELEEAVDDQRKAENRKKFFDQTGAQYIRLIDKNLPVNPLYAGKSAPDTANIASRISSLIKSFGPQMSAKQEESIRDAYQSIPTPDFPSLVRQLEIDGGEGVPMSILKKIVGLNIFATAEEAIPFEEWIAHSNIIDLKPLDNDTRILVVAFILNFFIERLNKNLSVKDGIQPLQMVLFVDEAHNILPKDGKAKLLEKLAREGRSWGFPLWLASQDADKFLSTGVDFADLASAGIHFSPSSLSPKEQKDILGGTLPKPLEKGEAALRLGGKLIIGKSRQFWRDGGQ